MKKLFLILLLGFNIQSNIVNAQNEQNNLLYAAPAIVLIGITFGLYNFLNNFNSLIGANIQLVQNLNENIKESKIEMTHLQEAIRLNNELYNFISSLDLNNKDKEVLRSIIINHKKSYSFQTISAPTI